MVLSVACALAAALLYGAGTVLQAIGVRRAAAATGASWVARARAGQVYAVGLVADALGFAASVVALRTLPLFVVESAVASSVAVTAVLAVLVLGARLGRGEVLALVVVGVGLGALALSAAAGRVAALPVLGSWLLLASVVPVLVLLLAGLRRRPRESAVVLAVCAGLGFGGSGIAARVLRVPDPWWHVLLDPVLLALLAHGAVALVAYGLALQRGSATTTAAVTFTVETVVPAAIGLAWLGDRVRPGWDLAALLGFVLTLAGCVGLAGRAEAEVPA